MKKRSGMVLITSILVAAAAAPSRAQSYPAWTGVYAGAGIGHGTWSQETTAVGDPGGVAALSGQDLTLPVDNAGSGWLGTITGGYDYQFFNRFVAGLLGDYDFTDIKGKSQAPAAINFFNTLGGAEKQRAAWALGGRLGWLLNPTLLAYGTGGYTQASFDAMPVENLGTFGNAGTGFSTASHTFSGWFLGAGLETQLATLPVGALFLRAEYRYADYGSAALPIMNSSGGFATFSGEPADLRFSPVVQTVRLAMTYKFK